MSTTMTLEESTELLIKLWSRVDPRDHRTCQAVRRRMARDRSTHPLIARSLKSAVRVASKWQRASDAAALPDGMAVKVD